MSLLPVFPCVLGVDTDFYPHATTFKVLDEGGQFDILSPYRIFNNCHTASSEFAAFDEQLGCMYELSVAVFFTCTLRVRSDRKECLTFLIEIEQHVEDMQLYPGPEFFQILDRTDHCQGSGPGSPPGPA